MTDAAKDLTPEDKKWIWNLLEKNMRPVYGPSAWKKEGKEKKAELDSEEARYPPPANTRLPPRRTPTPTRLPSPPNPARPWFRPLPLCRRGGRRGALRVRAAGGRACAG